MPHRQILQADLIFTKPVQIEFNKRIDAAYKAVQQGSSGGVCKGDLQAMTGQSTFGLAHADAQEERKDRNSVEVDIVDTGENLLDILRRATQQSDWCDKGRLIKMASIPGFAPYAKLCSLRRVHCQPYGNQNAKSPSTSPRAVHGLGRRLLMAANGTPKFDINRSVSRRDGRWFSLS